MDLLSHWGRPTDQHLDFLGASAFTTRSLVYQACLARTVADALGAERAAAARRLAQHKAGYQLLRSLLVAAPTPAPHDRLRLAGEVFKWLGHGVLDFSVTRSGGEVRGTSLYETRGHGAGPTPVPTGELASHPLDAGAAGYAAAAAEVAHDLTPGSIVARESACVAAGGEHCTIGLASAGDMFGTRGLVPMAAEDALRPAPSGEHGERLVVATDVLRRALRALQPGAEGGLELFGIERVRALEDANNRLVFETLAVLEHERPSSVEALGVLLQDAARIDAFVGFGGLLRSELWGELEAPPGEDPLSAVIGCVAMARASGHGSIGLESFDRGRALALVSSGSPASVYGRLVAERGLPFVDPTLAGIGVAAMQLADEVPWDASPKLDHAAAEHVAAAGTYVVEQRSAVARGDDYDRVLVRVA